MMPATPLRVNAQPAVPLLRSQSSLEQVLSFALYSPPPSPKDLAEAQLLYHEIMKCCREDGVFLVHPSNLESGSLVEDVGFDETGNDVMFDDRVHVGKLFECLLEYCPTADGRSNVTRMVLVALFATPPPGNNSACSLATVLPVARQYLNYTPSQRQLTNDRLKLLAQELLQSFFVPLKAQGRCTPSASSLISPTSRSEVTPSQGIKNRLLTLRALVLARDGYACVATGLPDKRALERRMRRRGAPTPKATRTEAAHIIPHSLNALDDRGLLSAQKHTVWRVMNIFDPGVAASLEGSLIDHPSNAVLLAQDLHDRFGALEAYFEAVEDAVEPNTYRFVLTDGHAAVLDDLRPKPVIALKNHEPLGTPQSRLPAPELLRLHRACCLILNMSGAAEYVERLLDDAEALMQSGVLAEDGGSDFGLFLKMRGLCDERDLDAGWTARRGVVTQ